MGKVGGRDAEHVGVSDRLGGAAGSEDVSDDAAEAGVRAAVGVDGGGVIMGFDLEADVEGVVEPDDAGVVFEDAHEPVEVEVGRRLKDCLFEEVVVVFALEFHESLEGFVGAVLAPGLGDGFELAIGGFTALFAEVGLDGLHFLEAEGELALAADADEGVIVEVQQGDLDPVERIRMPLPELLEANRAPDALLDGRVGEDAVDESVDTGHQAGDDVGPDGAAMADLAAEVSHDGAALFGLGIGHAGLWEDVDGVVGVVVVF